MARCGRCGMFSEYPEGYHEQKWAGTCLWYQIRLREEEVFDLRNCNTFFERIPGEEPLRQFNYKIQRENIGSAYRNAKASRVLSIIALVVSVGSLVYKVFF